VKYLKRAFTTALVSFLMLSTFYGVGIQACAANNGYTDIQQGQWFYETVIQATAMELFSGYPNGKFGPDDTVTRSQAVQVLYNHYGIDLGTDSGFTDVSQSDWFAKAVTWASKSSLVNGVGNSSFSPGGELSREQLVSILYAKAGKPDVNPNLVLGSYTDYKDVSSWARDAFAWAVKAGVIQGTSGDLLLPRGIATRAQMATIMIRYIGIVDGETLPSVGIPN